MSAYIKIDENIPEIELKKLQEGGVITSRKVYEMYYASLNSDDQLALIEEMKKVSEFTFKIIPIPPPAEGIPCFFISSKIDSDDDTEETESTAVSTEHKKRVYPFDCTGRSLRGVKLPTRWIRSLIWNGEIDNDFPVFISKLEEFRKKYLGEKTVILIDNYTHGGGHITEERQNQFKATLIEKGGVFYKDKEIFIIHFYTAFDEASTSRLPTTTFFGEKVYCRDRYESLSDGFPIVAPEGTYGEIAPDFKSICIFNDVFHSDFNESLKHFLKALSQIDSIFSTPTEERQKTLEEINKSFLEKTFTVMMEKKKTSIEEEIADIDSEVKNYSEKLVSVIRNGETLVAQLNGVKELVKIKETYFKTVVDSLYKIKKIKKVTIKSLNLCFNLDSILVTDPRDEVVHNIGEFNVSISLSDCKVKILNTKYWVKAYEENMQAPHVFHAGNPCLGSMSNYFPKLVATFDFNTIATLIISFLESVNVDDRAGAYVNRWPVVKSDGTLEIDTDYVKVV